MMDASEQRNELKKVLEVASAGKYLILDTETTGLYDGEICEVCLLDAAGAIVYYSLVKPVHGIPADATRIHGITNDRVAAAPSFTQVAPFLIQHMLDRDVLVYNAIYDRKMLHQSAEKVGIDHIHWKEFSRWLCVMESFAVVAGSYNSYHGRYLWKKLTEAAQYYGISAEGAHGALADCRMTLAIVKSMYKKRPGALADDGDRKYGDDF